MARPAHQLDPAPWTGNVLPAWITSCDRFASIGRGVRATLQAIADACDAPDRHGNLRGAFGGDGLARSAGVAIRTLWRHVALLEAAGFLVTLGRGGVFDGRVYGNVYGIPASPGSLDGARVRRAMQRMRPLPNGRWAPTIVAPGAQTDFLADQEGLVNARRSDGCSGHIRRDNMSRVPCQHGTPLGLCINRPGVKKNHGGVPSPVTRPEAGGSRGSTFRGGALSGLSVAVLRDAGSMLERFSRASAAGLGGLADGDRDRLRWMAAAQHALRVGKNPPALFAFLVRGKRWLYITNEDEERAMEAMRAVRGADESARRDEDREFERHPFTRRETAPMTPDGRNALGLLLVARGANAPDDDDVLWVRASGLARFRGWTRERFDAAMAEARRPA